MAFSFFRWDALERAKDNLNLTEAQWDAARAVMVAGGLALAGAAAYWGGKPLWSHWQSRQALRQSRAFAEKKDYPSMLLALRRATQLAPADRFVWEETARELGQIGSPEELTAREELTRLEPGDRTLRLAFAQDALRFGRYDTARSALDAVDPSGKNDVVYQRLAVALAVAQKQPEDLRVQLARLIELDPGNNNARFTYAALRLWGLDPGAAAARAELERLLSDPAVRVRAAIELVSEAARRGTPRRVHEIIARCLGVFSPGSSADRSGSEIRAWEALLRGLKEAAPPSPTDTALMARWLADLGRRSEALAWLKGLPASLRSTAPVLDLTAQLAAEERDDTALDLALRAGAWGAWPEAAWKLAIECRRLAGGGAHGPALAADFGTPPPPRQNALRPAWAQAAAACGDSLDGLRNLSRLAAAWRMPREAEAGWLAIIDRAPAVVWAYDAVRASYLSRNDLTDLLALYGRWAEQFPLDEVAAERWLTLAALLDRTTAAINSRAENLQGTDAPARIARAAVSWRRGRPRDAEKLLLTLSDTERKQPQSAFWITLVESDLGRQEAAAEALKTALEYPRSPEESRLLGAAAKKIRLRPGD